jgi:hypothetical protein
LEAGSRVNKRNGDVTSVCRADYRDDCRSWRTLSAMLSPEEIARKKADIAILEKARDNCFDTGLRQVIDDWIKDAENKMAAEAKKDS